MWESAAADRDGIAAGSNSHKFDTSLPIRTAQRAIICLMNIRVECYSGYRGDETPLAVWIGERRIGVAEVLDRWLAPDHRYFKFRGDDQGIYIIRNDVVSLAWQITFYQDSETKPGPVRGPAGGTA